MRRRPRIRRVRLPNTIEEALTPRIRFYLNAIARAGEEVAIDVVGCPVCGVAPGEYCRGEYKPASIMMHTDRRLQANRWHKAHPEEWIKLKDATFARIIRRRGR